MRTKFDTALGIRLLYLGLLGLALANAVVLPFHSGLKAQEISRKIKTKIDPEYPELARRLNLKGMARVQVTIAPGGAVKEVKEIGGNPVLLDALVRAVKKWKYEPGDKESVFEVKFFFDGS